MSLSKSSLPGSHDDESFAIYYYYLSGAQRSNPENGELNRFFAAVSEYMTRGELDGKELETIGLDAYAMATALKEKKEGGRKLSPQEVSLLGGAQSAYYLFREIDVRQRFGVLLSAALCREVTSKAGRSHLRRVA